MMRSSALYWGCIYFAFILCMAYNLITSKRYGIPRWKFTVITILAFGFNWGASYLLAWVEAGFRTPEAVNGVRAWLFAPFYFLSCALVFRIEPKRLMDAITPCYILGFAFGKLGCVFGDCCYGYAYSGPLHIYNSQLGYNVFPVQLVESVAALLLFIGFVIYVIRSGFKITGRQYPAMLVLYTGRFFFEYLRDNVKIWHGLSALSFHALAGGIAGAIWLFFTSPAGVRTAAVIRNLFRKLSGKKPVRVPGVSEAKVFLRQHTFDYVTEKEQPTKKELLPYMIGSVAVLLCCVLILTQFAEISKMMIGLVAYFAVISAALLIYCLIRIKHAV